MAQCMYSNCTEPAIHKCTGWWCNGGVFCVLHIQFIHGEYICDLCSYEQNKKNKEFYDVVELVRRERKEKEEKERLEAYDDFVKRYTPRAGTIRHRLI